MAMIAIDSDVGGSGDNQTYKLYRHLKTLTVHENVVFYIVSGSLDESIRVWDVKTDKCVQVINDHSMPVTFVHYIS
ncbi:COMPASS component SWD3 [Vigna unguiculata]|uniref:COMPASS component SWD3 n=1 Tax=Vigna unguiculata TaxID=3917 RepID=A0A4D6M2T7_VIGUN|nr:COMPASS component SWD3 [Vigna unguiculata]